MTEIDSQIGKKEGKKNLAQSAEKKRGASVLVTPESVRMDGNWVLGHVTPIMLLEKTMERDAA